MSGGSLPQPTRRHALRWLAAGSSAVGFARLPAFGQPAISDQKPPSPADMRRRIEKGIALLNKLYWCPELDIWLDRSGDNLRAFFEGSRNPPWWSAANGVEMLIDFMNATGGHSHDTALAAMHARHHLNPDHLPAVIEALNKRGQWSARDEALQKRKPREHRSTRSGYQEFCNEYLDDSGWWGIAWLKMHQRTQEPQYLVTARAIQAHMAAHRRPETDGGGVIWNLEQQPVVTNAISNLLFLILSARLFVLTKEPSYLEAAKSTEAWIRREKLYDGVGIVDAPGHQNDHWTYNQGTWAGSLAALHEATGDAAYLDECARFLTDYLDKGGALTPDDVIREKLSTKGWDTALFKGVLANYLGQTQRLLEKTKSHPELAARLDRVLTASAASLVTHSTGPDGQFAMQWEAGAQNQEYNYNTLLAGLMLLTSRLAP